MTDEEAKRVAVYKLTALRAAIEHVYSTTEMSADVILFLIDSADQIGETIKLLS